MIKISITLKIHALLSVIKSRGGYRKFRKREPICPTSYEYPKYNGWCFRMSEILTTLKIEKETFKWKEVNDVIWSTCTIQTALCLFFKLGWQEEEWCEWTKSFMLYFLVVTHASQNYITQKCHKQLTCQGFKQSFPLFLKHRKHYFAKKY